MLEIVRKGKGVLTRREKNRIILKLFNLGTILNVFPFLEQLGSQAKERCAFLLFIVAIRLPQAKEKVEFKDLRGT